MIKPKYQIGMTVEYNMEVGRVKGRVSGVIKAVEYSNYAKKYFYRIAHNGSIEYVFEDKITDTLI